MKKSNFDHANEIKFEKRDFIKSVMYSYIMESPKTTRELMKLMNLSETVVFMHTRAMEDDGFLTHEKTYLEDKGYTYKKYSAINEKKYPWNKRYLKSADPRRDYFDSLYPDIHKELRDAIYEGRINRDIIRVHKESDSEHWEMKKRDTGINFQSTLSGEYVI